MSENVDGGTDRFKQFMREFYSQRQHWRIMKFIEHTKAFFNSWGS